MAVWDRNDVLSTYVLAMTSQSDVIPLVEPYVFGQQDSTYILTCRVHLCSQHSAGCSAGL